MAILRLPEKDLYFSPTKYICPCFCVVFIIALILLLLRRCVAAASFNAFSAAAATARAILTAAARTQYKRGANSRPSARRCYVIIAVCRSPSAGRTFRANVSVTRRRRSPHRRTRTITAGLATIPRYSRTAAALSSVTAREHTPPTLVARAHFHGFLVSFFVSPADRCHRSLHDRLRAASAVRPSNPRRTIIRTTFAYAAFTNIHSKSMFIDAS